MRAIITTIMKIATKKRKGPEEILEGPYKQKGSKGSREAQLELKMEEHLNIPQARMEIKNTPSRELSQHESLWWKLGVCHGISHSPAILGPASVALHKSFVMPGPFCPEDHEVLIHTFKKGLGRIEKPPSKQLTPHDRVKSLIKPSKEYQNPVNRSQFPFFRRNM